MGRSAVLGGKESVTRHLAVGETVVEALALGAGKQVQSFDSTGLEDRGHELSSDALSRTVESTATTER
jgi:hypothetical protein